MAGHNALSMLIFSYDEEKERRREREALSFNMLKSIPMQMKELACL